VALVQYTFTHKQYIEQHTRYKQYIEQHNSLTGKSADRASSLNTNVLRLQHSHIIQAKFKPASARAHSGRCIP